MTSIRFETARRWYYRGYYVAVVGLILYVIGSTGTAAHDATEAHNHGIFRPSRSLKPGERIEDVMTEYMHRRGEQGAWCGGLSW